MSQFEIDPTWAPRLDESAIFTRTFLYANELAAFEHLGIYAAKVINASSVGSHSSSD